MMVDFRACCDHRDKRGELKYFGEVVFGWKAAGVAHMWVCCGDERRRLVSGCVCDGFLWAEGCLSCADERWVGERGGSAVRNYMGGAECTVWLWSHGALEK